VLFCVAVASIMAHSLPMETQLYETLMTKQKRERIIPLAPDQL